MESYHQRPLDSDCSSALTVRSLVSVPLNENERKHLKVMGQMYPLSTLLNAQIIHKPAQLFFGSGNQPTKLIAGLQVFQALNTYTGIQFKVVWQIVNLKHT